MNKEQIRNPHLIYPGMVLLLDRARGTLSIAGGPGAGPAKLSPRIRAESLAQEQIPSIPPSAIEPFLSRPLVIEPDGLDKAPTIIATQQDRVILSAGDKAYVRGIGDSKEQTWYVYRPGKALVDPDTDRILAYEAIYLGSAQVTRPGDPTTVVLTSAVQEVNAGDKLVAAGRAQARTDRQHLTLGRAETSGQRRVRRIESRHRQDDGTTADHVVAGPMRARAGIAWYQGHPGPTRNGLDHAGRQRALARGIHLGEKRCL